MTSYAMDKSETQRIIKRKHSKKVKDHIDVTYLIKQMEAGK